MTHPAVEQIRWIIRRDMPRVLEIESLCFATPWAEDDFNQRLRQRNTIGLVYDTDIEVTDGERHAQHAKAKDDPVAGYVIYELHRDHLEIINLAVHPQFQRKLIATSLITKLKNKLNTNGRTKLYANVAESNLSAQLFMRYQSFIAVETLNDFFSYLNNDGEEVSEACYRFTFDMLALEPPPNAFRYTKRF